MCVELRCASVDSQHVLTATDHDWTCPARFDWQQNDSTRHDWPFTLGRLSVTDGWVESGDGTSRGQSGRQREYTPPPSKRYCIQSYTLAPSKNRILGKEGGTIKSFQVRLYFRFRVSAPYTLHLQELSKIPDILTYWLHILMNSGGLLSHHFSKLLSMYVHVERSTHVYSVSVYRSIQWCSVAPAYINGSRDPFRRGQNSQQNHPV